MLAAFRGETESCFRFNRNKLPEPSTILKLDPAGRLCKQRVIPADTHIDPRLELRSPLAHDNRAARNQLAGKSLDAEHFRLTVAPVS